MASLHIPIRAIDPPVHGGCSACLSSDDGPVCRAGGGGDCVAPVLVGPQAEVQRLIGALAGSLGFPPDSPEDGGVRALTVHPGEVELRLAFQPGCGGGSELADRAFQTLRGLLPDTDIYVLPSA